ncbi:putative DNA-binding protein [Bacillus sp. TS-2]|nr:putative DNA-binding protein [Bacillus sp. TS-2]
MEVYYDLMDGMNPLSLESIGSEWEQPPVIRNSGYPYYHWIQTLSGEGILLIEKEAIILKPGEGVLIPPFIPHQYDSNKPREWVTNFVTIGGSLASQIPIIIDSNHFLRAKDTDDFSFSKHITEMLKNIKKENKKNTKQRLSIELYTFLLNLKDFGTKEHKQTSKLYQEYVNPAIHWIEAHYQEKHDIVEISNQLFISSQYLNRLFKRYMGISIHQYIIAYRLKKAKELLVTNRTLKIQDVSFMTGFTDCSHFISSFKKQTGYTPKEFRQIH